MIVAGIEPVRLAVLQRTPQFAGDSWVGPGGTKPALRIELVDETWIRDGSAVNLNGAWLEQCLHLSLQTRCGRFRWCRGRLRVH